MLSTALRGTGRIRALALLSTLLTSIATSAFAASYQPQALTAVLERVRQTRAAGQVPVVLFDLDDTLINSRPRTARILNEFAAEAATRERFPYAAARLAGIPWRAIQYDVGDTFHSAGINDAAALEAARAYWKERYFTSAYCAWDPQITSAASYVRAVRSAGAVIVYLTGRPAPLMEQGTRASLHRQRFPLNENAGSVLLVMKPAPEMDDLAFKKAAFDRIATIGRMIAVFENEPANLNAMSARFTEAIPVFVDTIHSTRPDLPNPNAAWIPDFR